MTEQNTVKHLRCRAVNVPMRRPLATAGGSVEIAPLILLNLESSNDMTGSSYVFCYHSMLLKSLLSLLEELDSLLKGEPLAPMHIEQLLRKRFRLPGTQGLAGMAMAGIDMAAWDGLSKSVDQPLTQYLGAKPQNIPAYNSCGLGLIGPDKAGKEANELSEEFNAIKIRLGYPDAQTDVQVIRAVRDAVGDDVILFADYNQSLSIAEAKTRIALLADAGLSWIEEPTTADDYAGHAEIRRLSTIPIQLGENAWGPHDMDKTLKAGACDLFMPDAAKIGGVSGWLRASALAESAGIPLSSHLYPEISAHLLSITPTRHWLEYVDWANPILQNPMQIKGGFAQISNAPGIGIDWDENAIKKYLIC